MRKLLFASLPLTVLGIYLMISGTHAQPSSCMFLVVDLDAEVTYEPEPNSVQYFSNGKVASEGLLADGKREGPWKEYYSDGTMREVGQYSLGVRTGTWTFWKPDGSLDRIEDYASPGLAHKIAPHLGELVRPDANWQTLAISAGWCLEYSQTHIEEKEYWINRAHNLILRSVGLNDNYYNQVLKAKIEEKIDFKSAQRSANEALRHGRYLFGKEFEEEDEYMYLTFLSSGDGC